MTSTDDEIDTSDSQGSKRERSQEEDDDHEASEPQSPTKKRRKTDDEVSEDSGVDDKASPAAKVRIPSFS